MSETPPENIPVHESILASTKKILGIDDSYTAFDLDVMTFINSAFTTLNDLGIGPVNGFMISDRSASWEDTLLDGSVLSSAKTYIYLKVRMAFDPPQTSFHLAAIQEQIKELEWRLNVRREETAWIPPVIVPSLDPVDTVW